MKRRIKVDQLIDLPDGTYQGMWCNRTVTISFDGDDDIHIPMAERLLGVDLVDIEVYSDRVVVIVGDED